MIYIKSLKKQRFRDDKPTNELYSVESYINPEKIVSIVPTKTSIYDDGNNIDYVATGSKITMSNNSRLTSDKSPKQIVDLINSCYEHDTWHTNSIGGSTTT
jgi:lipopolysaccharide export system protein LptA